MKYYILLLSGVISVALSSYLSAVRPWGMQDQTAISAEFSTIITPAGFTFSIWWIIYASWIIFWAYVLYKKINLPQKSVYLLASAQVISTLWLIPSQFVQIPLSFLVMIVIFVLLFILVQQNEKNTYFSLVSQLFFGWIVIASIANFHQTLVYFDIYFYPVILGVVSIILWFVLNLYFLKKYNYYIPIIVLAWALYGIIQAQESNSIILSSYIALAAIPIVITLKHYEKK